MRTTIPEPSTRTFGSRMFRRPIEPRPAPRVVLVESDPYLAFLIEQNLPDVEVVVDPNARAAEIDDDRDVVVVEAERAPLFVSSGRSPRVVALADAKPARRRRVPGVSEYLARPFLPTEVRAILRSMLGMPTPSDPGEVEGRLRARTVLGAARMAGAALAAVIELSAPEGDSTRAIVLAAVFAYATLRLARKRPARFAALTDVAIACGLLAVTGGTASSYGALAVILVVAAGLETGPLRGVWLALIAAAGALPAMVADGTSVVESGSWFAMFMLAGFASGLALRTGDDGGERPAQLLVEANRVLSSLYRVARAMPGALDRGTIAEAAADEMRNALRATTGALVLIEGGAFSVRGSFGLDPGALTRDAGPDLAARVSRGACVIKQEDAILGPIMGDQKAMLAVPVLREGVLLGVLLCGCSGLSGSLGRAQVYLRGLAAETAVALDNANLFSRVRQLTIDEERQRYAHDLHDGVAQALTHVRLELALISRRRKDDEALRAEVDRLARVVERAGQEVRGMINGLRSSLPPGTLSSSLQSYLKDLQGVSGPQITFDASGFVRADPALEADVFRIAQEAVSNALQHAHAQAVHVTLAATERALRLAVDDDGIGLHVAGTASRDGVGLVAMRERALRIGGIVRIERLPNGGTRVELSVGDRNMVEESMEVAR